MDNLENNNKDKQTSKPIDPAFNVVSPSGLQDRMSQKTSSKNDKHKGRIVLIAVALVLLIVIGVGGWWYYAQWQALLLLKQAQWDWGVANLENYQQKTNLSLDVNSISDKQEDMYAMLFGGEKFQLNIDADSKNVGPNLDSDARLVVKAGEFDLDISLKTKKVDNKLYFLINAGDLEKIFGGFIPIKDFSDVWLEIDIDDIYEDMDNAYQVSIDEDNIAKINIQFNNFLEKLKANKIFDVTDLKKDANGLRRLQLNVREDKVETLVILFIDYIADTYETVLELDDSSPIYIDYRKEYTESFEQMKREKPADLAKFKKMFESIDFIISIDPQSKNIHGLELAINDLILDSGSDSTIINGNIKYLLNKIDYYDINIPDNVQTIGDIRDFYQESETEYISAEYNDSDQDGLSDYMESFYNTDINNPDSDGDGYLDGAEVENGYNPMGDGKLEFDSI